ncbi:MAG TPA: ABC transporter ATP-binding protein [Clostridia bacterium]|nr:ABC transporter ATP-binding protein [Clostridia bacterium]
MKDLFKHIIDFLKKNKGNYFIGILLLVFVDGLQMITPLIIGNFTDALSDGLLTMRMIYKYVFLVLIIAIAVAVGRFGWRMYIIGISKRLEKYVRNKVFRHLENMSQNYYNNHKTGDLMAHCTNDISMIRMAFGGGTIMIIDSLFMTIITIILMITRIDFRLTLIALSPLPFIAILVLLLSKVMRRKFKAVQEAFSTMSEVVQESFGGIRIIKSFVQETSELEKFNRSNKNNFDKNMDLIKLQGLVFPLVSLITMISIIISLIYGGSLVINNEITIGNLVSFLSYVSMLTWPMMALGFVYHRLQQGRVSLERINKILDTEPEIKDGPMVKEELNDEIIKPNIEIKDLSFKYPDTNEFALKNISLSVNSGETLAIVGKTGSGKTTLVNLLLRQYNIPDEKIKIDEYDLLELPIRKIREMIGYVPQDNFLFSKSIEENIGFSNSKISFDNIKKVSKIAMVHSEIIKFEGSYQTLLGERGVNMSGGQKQRVSIARALAKDPDIIILDDSLSAVDTKTEESILNHLAEELKDKTSIIIAHRVSTIKSADKIIVLDHGSIVESGNHKSLLEDKGYYYDLYQKQLIEEKLKGGN